MRYQPIGGRGSSESHNISWQSPDLSSPKRGPLSERKRGFGGLVHFMAALNSLVLAFIVLVLGTDGSKLQNEHERLVDELPIVGLAFLAFALGVCGHSVYNWMYSERRPHQSEAQKVTHAGGVVFKRIGEDLLYLIVSSRAAAVEQWVFPKAHIENGETPEAAAVREVEEEAGVLVCVRGDLGVVRFSSASADTRSDTVVKFYTMEWLVDAPGTSRENRGHRWLPFHEAVRALSFIESKRLLTAAYLKTTS
ncbi:MAG: NUDIX domain-containing protein [Nitrospira sp. CR2.1]|nr:NUDIX domain-containing protein [Nitrospira sp. CR2.1]